MKRFANPVTLRLCLVAGIISALITFWGFLTGLDTFHGSPMDLLYYLLTALIDATFNGAMAFVLCGVGALPVLRYLEARIIRQSVQGRPASRES